MGSSKAKAAPPGNSTANETQAISSLESRSRGMQGKRPAEDAAGNADKKMRT